MTTSAQTPGTTYTVTVAATVTDTAGTGVQSGANSTTFSGFAAPATLMINEVNVNISGGCDLIELRATSDGSLGGYVLRQRDVDVMTFPVMDVAKNDLIVVHFDSGDTNCNPTSIGNETTAKDELPQSANAKNYDTAWDLYSSTSGLTATTNVFQLLSLGQIVDALFLHDDGSGTVASATVTAAQEVGNATEWEQSGGGVPSGGYTAANFRTHAVGGAKSTTSTAGGTAIQRTGDTDTNTKDDWSGAINATWGAKNAGQSDL